MRYRLYGSAAPSESARLLRARYNNTRVAKTTREIKICLREEKGGETSKKNSRGAVPLVGAKVDPCTGSDLGSSPSWRRKFQPLCAICHCRKVLNVPRKMSVRNVLCRGSSDQDGCIRARTAGLGPAFLSSFYFFPLQAQTAALASLEHVDRNADRTWRTASVSQDIAEGWMWLVEVQTTLQEEQEHPNLPREREQSRQGCGVRSRDPLQTTVALLVPLTPGPPASQRRRFPACRDSW